MMGLDGSGAQAVLVSCASRMLLTLLCSWSVFFSLVVCALLLFHHTLVRYGYGLLRHLTIVVILNEDLRLRSQKVCGNALVIIVISVSPHVTTSEQQKGVV